MSSKNGENSNAYRILVAKPDREKPLGKSRRKYVFSTKKHLREVDMVMLNGLRWFRTGTRGTSGRLLSRSKCIWGSVKCWQIPD
jgi:hypothetical protein